jgi:O-antigen ligase
MQTGDKPRWVANVYFILLLLVITTLIISWFNVNSYFIIITVLFLLVTENMREKLRIIFSNKLFLGFFILGLLEVAGLLYTDNLKMGWKNIENKSMLVAIPFILLAGPFRGKNNYKKIMTAYCLLLFVISLVSLGIAVVKFIDTKNVEVLFYHDLVSPLKQNAIVFTLFILAALLYLLSQNLYLGNEQEPHRRWRMLLIIYFIIFSILLASKLLLFVLPVILMYYLLRRYPAKKRIKPILAASLLIITGAVVLATTNNPIRARYIDILRGNIDLAGQEKFSGDVYFNGVQLRMLEYRFVWEILREQKAWIIGVSPGDSQDLLDQKYRQTNMYTGVPGTNDTGFLGYDSHNQFLEYLLQSGIIGLLAIVFVCYTVIARAVKERSREALFFCITLFLVFLTEALLELQHGRFLFTFFPFLFLYNLNNQHKIAGQP